MENNNLTEQYQYNGDGEHISDVSNKPLDEIYVCPNCQKEYKSERFFNKHVEKCVEQKEEKIEIQENILEKKVEENSFYKNLYSNLVRDNKRFKLFIDNKVIFDSRKNEQNLIFNNDHFKIGNKVYPYKNIKFESNKS